MSDRNGAWGEPHLISVVTPVYQGEMTLAALIAEIEPFVTLTHTPDGHPFRVTEVLLVHDNGPDDSARVIRELVAKYEFVRPIWLSKNFGQHAATIAGMASSGGEWIATIDEDGQHNPADLSTLLDTAMREQSSVVYANPTNAAPHGRLRNFASRTAKWVLNKLINEPGALDYHSYRLMLGSVGRGVAAYSGAGAYLDIAIGWIAGKTSTAPVTLRDEGNRTSGYSIGRLFGHFRRMILTSGTRGLRFVSGLGAVFALGGVILAIWVFVARITGTIDTQGWASTVVIVLVSSGAILVSLGIIAEYIGINVNMALGKPAYLITSDPADGPLGRRRPVK